MATSVKRRHNKLPSKEPLTHPAKIENATLATRIYGVSSSGSVCGLIKFNQCKRESYTTHAAIGQAMATPAPEYERFNAFVDASSLGVRWRIWYVV
jgi:hypothetical protein